MLVEAFNTEPAVEALDKGVLDRLAWLGMPAGTRTIRLKLRGQRGSGTNKDAYFNSVAAGLLLYGSGVGTLPPVLATWRFQVPTSEA